MGLIVALSAPARSAAASTLPDSPAAAAVQPRLPRLESWEWAHLAVLLAGPVVLAALWLADVIRPGSPARAGRRDVSAHPWYVWVFGGVVVAGAGSIGASLAAVAPGMGSGGTRAAAITALSGYAAAVGAGLLMMRLALGGRAPVPGAQGLVFSRRDVPAGLLGAAIVFPVAMFASFLAGRVHAWVTGEPPAKLAHEVLRRLGEEPTDPWIWVVVAGAVVGAPIAEEITFRVFFQSGLLRLTGRVWASVLVAAGVFALIHRIGAAPVPWHALAPLFVLGVGMGLAYERTRRPGVPILMHAGFNAANVALVLAAQ